MEHDDSRDRQQCNDGLVVWLGEDLRNAANGTGRVHSQRHGSGDDKRRHSKRIVLDLVGNNRSGTFADSSRHCCCRRQQLSVSVSWGWTGQERDMDDRVFCVHQRARSVIASCGNYQLHNARSTITSSLPLCLMSATTLPLVENGDITGMQATVVQQHRTFYHYHIASCKLDVQTLHHFVLRVHGARVNLARLLTHTFKFG